MKNYAKAFLKAISLVALIYCCFECKQAPPPDPTDSLNQTEKSNQADSSNQDKKELAPYTNQDDSIIRVSLSDYRAGAKWKKNKLYTICIKATLDNPNYQNYRLLIEEQDQQDFYPVVKVYAGAGTIQVSYLHRRTDFDPVLSIKFFKQGGGHQYGTISTTPEEVPECGIHQAVTDKLKSASVSNSKVLVTIDEK